MSDQVWTSVVLPIAVVLIAQVGGFAAARLAASSREKSENLQYVRGEVRTALSEHLTASMRAHRELVRVYKGNVNSPYPPTGDEWERHNELATEYDLAEGVVMLVASDEYIAATEESLRAERRFRAYVRAEYREEDAPHATELWQAHEEALYKPAKAARRQVQQLSAI